MKQIISILCAITLLLGTLIMAGCGARDAATGKRDASTWVDDKSITLSIETEFLADDLVKFLDFNAYSYGGHVYIVGIYESREQVDRAVSIAKSFEGVKTVSTYFEPKGFGPQCIGPKRLELGTAVRHKIVTDKDIWASDITVDIIQCTIILLGYVDNQEQKAAAEAHALATDGVDKIKSFLRIRE